MVIDIAVKLASDLKQLLLASNLGLNKHHPLAGWQILTILYHDGAGSTPMTLDTLATKYNMDYLDMEAQEKPIANLVLKSVLDVLAGQAHLIEVSSRKVRLPMKNGVYHNQQSYVYKITSSGIEYLTMMQRVVDAENTVTANINRIDEYCELIDKLSAPNLTTDSTQLYNDFAKMLTAYTDVMKGMHKVDDDLSDLAHDLAFNHGSDAAEHLQAMLTGKAIPAFTQLLHKGDLVQSLANSETFSAQVANSQQGSDDLDAGHATDDTAQMVLRFQRTQAYVQRQLRQLALGFMPTSNAIDSSLDSVYMLFQTILDVVRLLSQEYDHVQRQTVDIKVLTASLDKLLTQYTALSIPAALPRHLAQDRIVTDASDLLQATTMGPVTYALSNRVATVATMADNPTIAEDDETSTQTLKTGLAEFQKLVMTSATKAVVDHDLTFETVLARDEVARLYSATGYDHYEGFAPFGRAVARVEVLPASGPVRLQYVGEKYSVWLPKGFIVEFAD